VNTNQVNKPAPMTVSFSIAKEDFGSTILKNFLFVLLLLFATPYSFGQENNNLEKVVIGNAQFILHTVQKNQTLYSIAKIYDCSQEEILGANKNISGIIKKGMVLKIPDHTYQLAKIDESKFIKHQTVSGDNYYQLKLKYGVEEEELLKYNPDLKDGLKAGKVILIPLKSKTKDEAGQTSKETQTREIPTKESASKETSASFKSKGTDQLLNVGLYLPISAAVTDSMKPTAKSLSFLAFYQGALLAVDQLSKSGLKVKLYVYDTEKSTSNVEDLIKKPEFLSLDLIIGPVYPENQKVASELSAKNRIPMVSPLSSDEKYAKTNPYYFQVNPAKNIRIETTAEYILKEFPKETIIFLEGEYGGSDTRQIRDYLTRKRGNPETSSGHTKTYNLWSKGTADLELQLKTDRPNILVMADVNEVNVSIAMNRLTLLSKKYPLILIGIQEFTRMQSIETENLHNVNLRYLSTFFVNYSLPAVTTFVENFKTEFGTEPSLFAYQGYDISTFFLKLLYKNEKFSVKQASDEATGLLHAAYHFKKLSDFGGYTNDSFAVVEYANTFEVKALGNIRQGN
jgi:ABC-type branched-subunit amino acid transport system substrate-binding protein/LysM repeat protein